MKFILGQLADWSGVNRAGFCQIGLLFGAEGVVFNLTKKRISRGNSKMLPTARRTAVSFAALAALSLSSLTAHAVAVQLDVSINGALPVSLNEGNLGCADTSAVTAICEGSGAVVGALTLNSWALSLDTDPVITAIVAVTNNSLVTQQYTLLFTLPILPAIPGGTVIGGSIQGGVTDNNGGGATLSVPTSSSFYTALIDAVAVQTMYAAPQSVVAGSFLSNNLPNLAFGTPIPSQAGPPALSTIAIRLDFLLTAGDSASFTSNFVVLPAVVPVPAAVWLFGSALGLMGVMRRKISA